MLFVVKGRLEVFNYTTLVWGGGGGGGGAEGEWVEVQRTRG